MTTDTRKRSRAEYQREWRRRNPDKATANARRAAAKLVRTPEQKLAHSLRVRLGSACRGHIKAGSAVRDLGCTAAELMAYLENRFCPGMSWANHGQWHIDHIVPLSSFNLQDRDQILAACHFTNLQPLWATDNLRKGAKI